MVWFILSLITALAVASQDAWIKKFFSRRHVYEMSSYPLVYSTPLFAITLPFIPVPPLDEVFLWSFLVGLPINAFAFVLYMKAIQISPLSLTIPYLSFTPVFMIFTGYLFLDEIPDMWGAVGVITVCAGSYILNFNLEKWSPLAPLTAIFRETGSWIMLLVSFLFSFSAVLGKLSINHSSALFFSISFFLAFNLFILIVLFLFRHIRLKTFKTDRLKGLIAGLLFYLHVLFHGLAISISKAVYMISVKRMSVLFSIIYGGLFFHEKNILIRFVGALFMFTGTVIILLKGR